jgi:xanthine dehydrogenase accessory factor
MKELFQKIEDWTKKNKSFAIATVIKTWGSSPRPVGSTMLISEEMEMAGSVSGGCVENAVVKAALPLIQEGSGKKLAYGVADEDAWAVGLSCGGSIQVFVERFLAFDEREEEKAAWKSLESCLQNNQGCVLLSRLADGPGKHTLVLPNGERTGHEIGEELRREALQAYKERTNKVFEAEGESWFLQIFPPKNQLLAIGAAHITVDLVDLAHTFGFETIVIDPRRAFADKTQFNTPPDQIYPQYPSEVLSDFSLDPYTYAVILSHDPKIDDNALHLLLPSEVAYIGALGSKKTHAKRVARLEAAGYSQEDIARIHAPIGLDINAKTPREIALAIMGEIIETKNKFL